MGRGPKPAKGKAKPAVSRNSREEDSKVRDLEKRLTEALRDKAQAEEQLQTRDRELVEAQGQQTATSEILRVISQAQVNVQPVFEAIADSAMRLFGAWSTTVSRYEDGLIRLVSARGGLPGSDEASMEQFRTPRRPAGDFPSDRVVQTRAIQHVINVDADPSWTVRLRELAQRRGYRSIVSVPMLHGDDVVGIISVTKNRIGGFAPHEISLLQTFADQAVIAIENVRLFNETKEALEQQTATAEILRVISSSPTDIQPVLDAVAENAARVCGADDALIFRVDGDVTRRVAHHGSIPVSADVERTLTRYSVWGRSVVDRRTVHVPDIEAEAGEAFADSKPLARQSGARTHLATPLMRQGAAIGAILIRRLEVRLFTAKQISLLQTFADQAVIAIENVRLFTETKEALERQTATSEILRVISQSPTDVQPVFDTIVRSAVRLCDGVFGALFRFDGEMLHTGAEYNYTSEALEQLHRVFPTRPSRALGTGRAILDSVAILIPDVEADPEYRHQVLTRAIGYRSGLFVPMLREDVPIGVIQVARAQPGPFSDTEIQLLKTFADQAVIAIENVRLFTELQDKNRALMTAHAQVSEALDQQTSTSEILRVIAASPTDLQPVFETIVRSAVRLCDGLHSNVYRVEDGFIRLIAHHNFPPTAVEEFLRAGPVPVGQAEGLAARVIRERTVIHVCDVETDLDIPEFTRRRARAVGGRSLLYVPMLREETAIGAIVVSRGEVRPFSTREIQLIQTFADQAVIAIENVRLFKELEVRNKDLTEALDQQTATSEILRIVSSSPTDVQPTFEAIAAAATALCEAEFAGLFRFDGGFVHIVAQHGWTPEEIAASRRAFPQPPGQGSVTARSILTAAVVQVADVSADSRVSDALRGFRTVLAVPMVQDGRPLGTITVARRIVRPFTEKQISLLQTFADQAVIAIENARLLSELQARTAELTRSVGELRALGEVGQAISSTLDLQTVLTTIVGRATQLAGVDAGVIYEYDEQAEVFVPRATDRLEAEIVETLIATPVRKGEGATGRLAEGQEPIQLSDILQAAEGRVRDTLGPAGYRALLAVPLVRENHLLGGLTVFRKSPGEFAPEVVDLLQTFATQSALAMQNARLFREIADKSRQLEVASQHKSEFLANMSHELRTPLNAIIGFSEVLSERMFGELNEKQEEYSKDIHASGQHLLSLINDILDLSKIEAGRMELELSDFHLPTALDSALTLVRERAGRRSIALHLSVDERLGQIQADERKVRQVVLNLLSNAIKFTPEGGRIEVRATPQDGLVEVAVNDTGVGIAPEDQETVFEEFRQVGTADKKVEGTGLGLTLCRKFVELHGGRIWVKSQLGAGSTFTFTMPVRRGE